MLLPSFTGWGKPLFISSIFFYPNDYLKNQSGPTTGPQSRPATKVHFCLGPSPSTYPCATRTKSPQSSAPPDHATSPIQESDLLPDVNRCIPPKPTGSPSRLLRDSLATLFLGGDSTRFDCACAPPSGNLSLMS